jgi:hypothetical protein
MAGAAVGSACALLSYGVYYRLPFSVGGGKGRGEDGFEYNEGEELRRLGEPRDLYGSKERDSLGEIRLDEEVIEGEEQA